MTAIKQNTTLFISLYTDEDVTSQLPILLRQRGYEARSAIEANMLNQPDEANLAYATDHNMVLYSFNVRDYMIIAQKWAKENRTHTGILLSNQFNRRQMGEQLRQILKFLDTVTVNEMINSVRYLSEFK